MRSLEARRALLEERLQAFAAVGVEQVRDEVVALGRELLGSVAVGALLRPVPWRWRARSAPSRPAARRAPERLASAWPLSATAVDEAVAVQLAAPSSARRSQIICCASARGSALRQVPGAAAVGRQADAAVRHARSARPRRRRSGRRPARARSRRRPRRLRPPRSPASGRRGSPRRSGGSVRSHLHAAPAGRSRRRSTRPLQVAAGAEVRAVAAQDHAAQLRSDSATFSASMPAAIDLRRQRVAGRPGR